MKILHHDILSEVETLDRLRNVRLKGFGRPFIYRYADIRVLESFPQALLTPPQRYVLRGTVDTIIDLAKTFERLGVDIFALRGALLFWTEGMKVDAVNCPPIPFLPPIVELSEEKGGVKVMLVNDGMHREFAGIEMGRKPNIIFIDNLPPGYPYYAYGFNGGWENVQVFEELPDVFQKKDYRMPDSYKDLFRQFNEVFPGVQEARKQSNPEHIKP